MTETDNYVSLIWNGAGTIAARAAECPQPLAVYVAKGWMEYAGSTNEPLDPNDFTLYVEVDPTSQEALYYWLWACFFNDAYASYEPGIMSNAGVDADGRITPAEGSELTTFHIELD